MCLKSLVKIFICVCNHKSVSLNWNPITHSLKGNRLWSSLDKLCQLLEQSIKPYQLTFLSCWIFFFIIHSKTHLEFLFFHSPTLTCLPDYCAFSPIQEPVKLSHVWTRIWGQLHCAEMSPRNLVRIHFQNHLNKIYLTKSDIYRFKHHYSKVMLWSLQCMLIKI